MIVEVFFECYKCQHKFEDTDGIFFCDSCNESEMVNEFKAAIKNAAEHKYIWQDKEHYVGWDSEKEKEIFMRGVRKGFWDALFFIASYLEDEKFVRFYEKLEEKKDKEEGLT